MVHAGTDISVYHNQMLQDIKERATYHSLMLERNGHNIESLRRVRIDEALLQLLRGGEAYVGLITTSDIFNLLGLPFIYCSVEEGNIFNLVISRQLPGLNHLL